MPAPRLYDAFLAEHLQNNRQMAFLGGPRQVGKTTTGRVHSDAYVNWDSVDDRALILAGPHTLAGRLGLDRLREGKPIVLLDELHKYPLWRQFLKGLFDEYADEARFVVTGSSRLDVYRRGGDSLMGRYFFYRMHPFSLAEALTQELPDAGTIVRSPRRPPASTWDSLWRYGGYPEPFLKRDPRFARRWQALRHRQLVREEIRDLTRVQQLDQLEVMARLLADRSGQQLVFGNLARQVRVSEDTVRRWVRTFSDLHLGFLVRPWHRNVSRSLRKEPKWYLRDWSSLRDPGARAETLVACHLLKAVEGWTDLGLGDFDLGYLRDKEKREVDFVVVRDGDPWFLVEAKWGEAPLSPSLKHFQDQIGAPFAFQVQLDGAYVDRDPFTRSGRPLVVPARTFLSQLL